MIARDGQEEEEWECYLVSLRFVKNVTDSGQLIILGNGVRREGIRLI